ncbi:MAG: RsmE family RNA methyltransferase [Candidatus Puniceispirillales bacterium]
MKVYSQSIRIFLSISLKKAEVFTIIEKQAHYLINVMRVKVGSIILVFNGYEGEYKVEIINKKNNIISCKVIEKVRVQYYEPELNLIFSLVKKDRIFNIIEKCTELGVTCFYPIVTERTQNFNYSFKKFGAYAIEASEQTRRLTIPKINPVQNLSSLLNNWNRKKIILLCNENDGIPVMKIKNKISKPVSILIGPEGGFSRYELEGFLNLEFVKSISLGPRILRSDTAAISMVASYQSIFGDWNL